MRLNTLRQCPKKAFWGGFQLSSGNNSINLFDCYDTAIKKLLETGGFSALRNAAIVRGVLEEEIPDEAFIMSLEKEANLSHMTDRVVRMGDILVAQGYDYIEPGKRYVYTINNKALTGQYHFVVKKNDTKYGVKVAYGKYDYSMKPGTKTHISTDTDLYVQYLATNMVPMVFSIVGNETGSGDVKDYDVEELADPKKMVGRFIYSYDFSQDHTVAEAELDELTKLTISANSAENHQYCDQCFYKDLCQIEDTDNFAEETDYDVSALPNSAEVQWTDAQKQLIETRTGETRVFAVAGSGKTTSISEMVVQMVKEDQKKTEQICLCTFTNKGVEEIKNKIAQRLSADGLTPALSKKMYITTLNGLGMDIIKHHAITQNLPVPELVDENKYVMIVANIVDRYPAISGLNYSQPLMRMFKAEGAVYRIIRYCDLLRRETADKDISDYHQVSRILSQDDSSNSIKNEDGVIDPGACESIRKIYNELRHTMDEKHLITYDDQIHKAARILDEDKDTLEHFRTCCKYLIVDEFQDTGVDQMRLVEKLYVPSDNSMLVVVGDASQSIMGFRGVGNENLLNFQQAYPKSKTIDMNANFRSTREICDVAEKVMTVNGEDVKLNTVQNGEPVLFIDAPMKDDALQKASEKVIDMIDDGTDPSDIAVIARTRKELLQIRHYLEEAEIPTVLSVSEFLKDDNEIIGAINLAAYLQDNGNFKALAIWLRHSDNHAFDSAVNPADFMALQSALLNEEFKGLSDTDKYARFIEKLHTAYDRNLTNAMKTYFGYEEAQDNSFTRAASYLDLINTTQSNAGAEREEGNFEAVTLTTVHSAKGREWKNVVVVTNGFKQASMKADADGSVELKYGAEEIRILFVAVTRARENEVIITNPYWTAAMTGVFSLPYETLKATGIKVTAPPKPKKAKSKKK